jgi:hypothetical protein
MQVRTEVKAQYFVRSLSSIAASTGLFHDDCTSIPYPVIQMQLRISVRIVSLNFLRS